MSQPTRTKRLGLLSAAVFENESEDGKQRLRTVSLSRRYFDRKDQEWRTVKLSLGEADVPVARLLLESIESLLIAESGNESLAGDAGDE